MRRAHADQALRRSLESAGWADLKTGVSGEIRAFDGAERSLDAFLSLNRLYAIETSELDRRRLQSMLGAAFAALQIGDHRAILIAFDQSSTYDSPNFTWFQARYARFVYIDRVIVAPAFQGRGLARALYARVAELASASGHTRLACEVNVDPPNPASIQFHAALGFLEVDRARTPGSIKTVSRMTRTLEGF